MTRPIQREVPLHRVQHQFCHARELYRGFVGGRGSGKSFVGAYDLIRRAKPGRLYAVYAPTFRLMQDATLRSFLGLARELQYLRDYRREAAILGNRAEVLFRSLDDPEKARGPNLSGAWIDEASLVRDDAWLIIIGALREAGEQGWLSCTFTPRGPGHWTYRTFATGQPNTALFRASTRDNPFLPRDFADTTAAQYRPEYARQEIEGEFVDLDGAEFDPAWFDDGLMVPAWPAGLVVKAMALDPSKGKDGRFGDYSAFVMVGRDAAGVYYCQADLARRSTPAMVADGLALYRAFAPDGLAIEINQYQELLAGEFARMAGVETLPLYGITNTVAKATRIRRLGPLLAQRRLRFLANDPGTQELLRQLQSFPLHRHDDGPDALEMAIRLIDELAGTGSAASQQAPQVWRP